RIHAAAVRGATAQEEAVGLYARHVLFLAADGDSGLRRDGVHVPHDERRDAAALLFRLSALGFRSALDDLGPAVPVREGQAQYPRRYRGAAVQAAAAQREAAREPQAVRQSRRCCLTGNAAAATMPQDAILSLDANFGMVMPGLAPGIF